VFQGIGRRDRGIVMGVTEYMSSSVSHAAMAVAILTLASGCGVVQYRNTTVTVRDEQTNAPLSDVRLSAQMTGELGKWNCGRVPLIQSGSTDQDGVWNVTLPTRRPGCLIVDRDGFEQKHVEITEETLDHGEIEVKLTPSGATRRLDK
jgi:hypothetical protein